MISLKPLKPSKEPTNHRPYHKKIVVLYFPSYSFVCVSKYKRILQNMVATVSSFWNMAAWESVTKPHCCYISVPRSVSGVTGRNKEPSKVERNIRRSYFSKCRYMEKLWCVYWTRYMWVRVGTLLHEIYLKPKRLVGFSCIFFYFSL